MTRYLLTLVMALMSMSNVFAFNKDCLTIGESIVDSYVNVSEDQFQSLAARFNAGRNDNIIVTHDDILFFNKTFPKLDFMAPGGSAANIAAGMAFLGSQTGFVGAVANDEAGQLFESDLRARGVDPHLTIVQDATKGTATLFSLIPEDHSRTLFAYLGVSHDIQLSFQELVNITEEYRLLLVDAFIWSGTSIDFDTLFDTHRQAGGLVAFSLAAQSVVKEKHAEIWATLPHVDIVMGNEDEVAALFDLNPNDKDALLPHLSALDKIFILTAGEQGAWVVQGESVVYIPANDVSVMDTTGAGDMFAAGFLHEYLHGASLEESGLAGAQMASYVIQQIGARPLLAAAE